METLQTRCLLCSLMCGVAAEVQGGDVDSFEYLDGGPPCGGSLCARGHYFKELYAHPKRLLAAGVRAEGGLEQVSWDEAVKVAQKELSQVIKNRDGASIGVIISGNASCEEAYLANVLARDIIQTNHVSNSASVEDMSLLAGGHGSPLEPSSEKLKNFGKSDHFLIVGDVFHRHPPLAKLIQERKYSDRKNVKIVVVDSKKSATTWFADAHLQPRPGTETAFFLQLALALYDLKGKKKAAKQVVALIDALEAIDLPDLEEITGIGKEAVAAAAEMLCAGKHGTVVVTGGFGSLGGGAAAVHALHLAAQLGDVDRRIVPFYTYGNAAGVYAMEQAVMNDTKSGKQTYVPLAGIVNALINRDIHGLLVFGEDLHSLLPSAELNAALEDLDFLLCSSSFVNKMTDMADVVLPRTEWFERSGSVLDCQGKVQALEAVCTPPGAARSDEESLMYLAKKLKGRKSIDIPEDLPAAVKDLAAGSGKSNRLTKAKVKALAEEFKAGVGVVAGNGAEAEKESTFLLVPEMGAVHFADGNQTRRFSWPQYVAAEPELLMSREDASVQDLQSGDTVNVQSAFGSGEFTLKVTGTLLKGVVSSSGHFPEIRSLFGDRLEQIPAGAAGIVPETVTVTKAG